MTLDRSTRSSEQGACTTTVCSECSRRFNAGTRFCPFDGTALSESLMSRQQDPLIGKLIDARYRIVSILGEGGMGIVYEARHDRLDRRFALKVLRADLAKDTNLCKRFIREARAAASVDHPGVVAISDFGALPTGQPYFVMEFLSGQSLTYLMHEMRPLPLERWVGIAKQLIDAVSAAHRANIVHRDLKPDNIQILAEANGTESVKVLDFGLAHVGGETRITKQGFVFGTPHYMSPEQAQGDPVDHRADIYALGVLMYEMSTGQLPFDADSYMGVLTKHIYTVPVRPGKLLGDRSLGALDPLIMRCLEKKPKKRFASLEALARELSAVLTETPRGLRVAARRPWSSSRLGLPGFLWWRRSPPPVFLPWLLFAVPAAFAAGIGWWAVSSDQRGGVSPIPRASAPQGTDTSARAEAAVTGQPSSWPPSTSSRSGPRAVASAEDQSDNSAGSAARVGRARPDASTTTPDSPQPGRKPLPARLKNNRSAASGRSPAPGPSRDPLLTSEIIDPWAEQAAQ